MPVCRRDLYRSGGVVEEGDTIVRLKGDSVGGVFVDTEPHDIGVFGGVVVMGSDDSDGLEVLGLEEELCFEVGFTDFEKDFLSALLREFVDELGDHLQSDPESSQVGVGGEIEQLESCLVQFVDHESDDPLVVFGDHADAVALPEVSEEIFLGPRLLKIRLLDLHHLGHVPPDQPANLDFQLACRLVAVRSVIGRIVRIRGSLG